MRIPFPERVNLTHVLVFATVLCSLQIIEGTNPFFSGCVFCFLMLAGFAFNIAGGVPYPSGAYIGFNAFFTMVLPQTLKVLLGEPADSNLRAPERTIEVYLLGMVAMLLAVVISKKLRRRRAFISGMLPYVSIRPAYIGCAALSAMIYVYLAFLATGGGNGSFTSFLIQANRFPLLTFVLGVIATVYASGGRRSISWPLAGMMLFVSLGALVTYSKEQLLSPFFTWGVTIALLGFQLNWKHFVVFFVGLILVVFYLVPIAQYGRGFEQTRSRTELTEYLLTHMSEVREATSQNGDANGVIHYFNVQNSLLHRIELTSNDDAIIDLTQKNGTFGYEPIKEGFENIVPHVLLPNKPVPKFGNTYAHEIGILSPDDPFTGVSFTPAADAYHQGGVPGVLFVETGVLALVFFILDSVIGDVRLNPVGLLATILVSRASFEGALWGAPALIGQYLFSNVLAAYFCAYVLPLLGSVFGKSSLSPEHVIVLPTARRRPPQPHTPLPVSSL